MKRLLTLLTTLLLLPLALTAQDLLGDAVLAKVGDKVFTSYDVRQAASAAEHELSPTLSEAERMEAVAEIRKSTLDSMVLTELVWMDFKTLKGKIPTSILQERIDQITQTQAGASEERLRDMLHQQNMTYKEFEDNLAKQLGVEMLLYDRTRRNIFVTDEQIQKYYDEHSQDFLQKRRYHVEAIMLPLTDEGRATASTIQQELAKGTPFADLAKKYSTGANAEQGGDLGWLETMAPQLQTVVNTLKPGETAKDPLVLGSALYLVRLAGTEGGEIPALDTKLKNAIKQILVDQEADRRLEEYRKALFMKYPVRMY